MNEWDHKWGESKSILFNHLGIKEPINALSALIMAIFIYTKMNKNLSVDNILKFFVLIVIFKRNFNCSFMDLW